MRRSLTPLWLLVALVGAPVVASWVLWLNPQWLPEGRTNNGELLEPARPLGTLTLPAWQTRNADLGAMRDKWVLLLLADHCNDACRQHLWDLRQIRLALEEGRQRVDRLLVVGDAPDPALAGLLEQEYPGMGVSAGAEPLARLRAALADAGATGVYVIDPMGNAMLHYRPGAPARGILKDMERLLKVSKNWENSHGRD